jgi:fission process protein 1
MADAIKVPTTSNNGEVIEEDVLRDSDARYLAYAQRVARVLGTSSRYLAFSSDVGEAFRPVVSNQIVRFSYLLTWGYVFSDVGYSTYSAYKIHPDNMNFVKDRAARATSFQLVGSVLLPFAIIHTGVAQSSRVFNKLGSNMKFVRTWGPSAVGLSIIPLLPRFVDHPVENAVDYLFKKYNPFNLEPKLLEMHHHKHE